MLTTVLDVFLKLRDEVENNLYAALALAAMKEYGREASAYEHLVWPYLHVIADDTIQKLAIDVVANVAKYSNASWTILYLMAHQMNDDLREYAKALMRE